MEVTRETCCWESWGDDSSATSTIGIRAKLKDPHVYQGLDVAGVLNACTENQVDANAFVEVTGEMCCQESLGDESSISFI